MPAALATPQTVIVTKKTALGGGAALTVTMQNQSRTYGSADAEFNYAVTGTLVNGDTYSSAAAYPSIPLRICRRRLPDRLSRLV